MSYLIFWTYYDKGNNLWKPEKSPGQNDYTGMGQPVTALPSIGHCQVRSRQLPLSKSKKSLSFVYASNF